MNWLQALVPSELLMYTVLTPAAWARATIEQETGYSVREVHALADHEMYTVKAAGGGGNAQ